MIKICTIDVRSHVPDWGEAACTQKKTSSSQWFATNVKPKCAKHFPAAWSAAPNAKPGPLPISLTDSEIRTDIDCCHRCGNIAAALAKYRFQQHHIRDPFWTSKTTISVWTDNSHRSHSQHPFFFSQKETPCWCLFLSYVFHVWRCTRLPQHLCGFMEFTHSYEKTDHEPAGVFLWLWRLQTTKAPTAHSAKSAPRKREWQHSCDNCTAILPPIPRVHLRRKKRIETDKKTDRKTKMAMTTRGGNFTIKSKTTTPVKIWDPVNNRTFLWWICSPLIKRETITQTNVITAMRTPTLVMENPLFLMITGKKGVNILVIKPLMTPSRTTPADKKAWSRQHHRIGKGGNA